MELRLEQWMQDIILATKGRYDLEGESRIDTMKRVVSTINGCDPEYFGVDNINHWLYQVYDELKKEKNTMISEHNLKEFILGRTYNQREHDEGSIMNAFNFLYGEIKLCRCRNIKDDEEPYELILELNMELATEEDLINRESNKYDVITCDSSPKNAPFTFYVELKGQKLSSVTNEDWWEGLRCANAIQREFATQDYREKYENE